MHHITVIACGLGGSGGERNTCRGWTVRLSVRSDARRARPFDPPAGPGTRQSRSANPFGMPSLSQAKRIADRYVLTYPVIKYFTFWSVCGDLATDFRYRFGCKEARAPPCCPPPPPSPSSITPLSVNPSPLWGILFVTSTHK